MERSRGEVSEGAQPEASASAARPRRWWRVLAVLLVVGLAAPPLALWAALRWIEGDAGRRQLQELVRREGLELHFERLVLSPLAGRFALHGLRVPLPEAHRAASGPLLELDRLEIEWSVRALARGRLEVGRVALEGVRAHVVLDEEGRSSLDLLFPAEAPAPPAEPAGPRSRALEALALPLPVEVSRLTVRGVRGAFTGLGPEGPSRHLALGDLELHGEARLEPGAPPRLQLELAAAPGALLVLALEGARHEIPVELTHRLATADGRRLTARAELAAGPYERFPRLELLEASAALELDAEGERVRLAIERLGVLGEVLEASLAASLPDAALLPILEAGEGRLRLDALPPELLPGLELEDVRLDYRVRPGGALASLEGEGRAKRVRFTGAGIDASLEGASLELAGAFDLHRAALELRAPVARLGVETPEGRVSIDAASFGLRAEELSLEGAPSGSVELEARAAKLEARAEAGAVTLGAPAARATARLEGGLPREVKITAPFERLLARAASGEELKLSAGSLELALAAITADLSEPLRWRLRSASKRLELAGAGGERVEIAEPKLEGRGTVSSTTSVALQLAAPLGAVQLRLPRGEEQPAAELTFPSARLDLSEVELHLDPEAPLRSRARLAGRAHAGAFEVALGAELAGGRASYDLALVVSSLGIVAPLLPPMALELDPAALSARLELTGRYADLDSASPILEHQLQGALGGLAAHWPGLDVRMPKLRLEAKHRLEQGAHAAEARVHFGRLEVGDAEPPSPLTLALDLRAAPARGTLSAKVHLVGEAGPELRATVDVREAGAALRWDAQAELGRLASLWPLLPPDLRDAHPVELSELRLTLTSTGEARGWQDPATLVSRGRLEANLEGLAYGAEELALALPAANATLVHRVEAGALSAELDTSAPRILVESGGYRFELVDTAQTVRFSADGPPTEGLMNLEVSGGIARVQQDALPVYPVGDVRWRGRLSVDRLASLNLDELVLENVGGGTRVTKSKRISRSRGPAPSAAAASSEGWRPGTEALALEGRFEQDLARLSGDPRALRAKGRIQAPFSVVSGDWTVFRVLAGLELEDVHLELPEAGIEIVGLKGTMGLDETLEWSPPHPPRLMLSTDRSPFVRVRSQDLQPFLGASTGLAAERVRWQNLELGPVSGSVQATRNLLAVQRLRIYKDQGLIAGQVLIDLPGAEWVEFRGSITGLMTRGASEPLDANAALRFTRAKLGVDGRMQIVRVGRAHLLELFDLLDPHREDPSLNGLRRVLAWGYPKRVRLGLYEGLMSMQVELGGLGSFLDIGEVRGVPLGPFIDRHLAPWLEW